MGAWSNTSFGNDWALDWTGDMAENGSVSMIRSALLVGKTIVPPFRPSFIGRMLGRKGYDVGLNASACSVALAAAEYVAAWLGHPCEDFPSKSADWIRTHSADFSADLVSLAIEAVEAVARHSELKLLWEEGDPTAGQEWHGVLDDLKHRLASQK